MAEPASTGGSAYAIAVGTITISGGVIGLQYDALIAALAGALFALSNSSDVMPRRRLFIWLVTTVMISAWTASIAASLAVVQWESLAPVVEPLRLLIAALCGAGARVLIPALIGRAGRTLGGASQNDA